MESNRHGQAPNRMARPVWRVGTDPCGADWQPCVEGRPYRGLFLDGRHVEYLVEVDFRRIDGAAPSVCFLACRDQRYRRCTPPPVGRNGQSLAGLQVRLDEVAQSKIVLYLSDSEPTSPK